MANRCQLCHGFTTTLRRGLCRVCFDGNIRPSELFDEMTTLTAAAAGAVKPPKKPTATRTRVHASAGNGSTPHQPARATGPR